MIPSPNPRSHYYRQWSQIHGVTCQTRFFCAAAGHLECGAIITCITPAAGPGPGSQEGRKLINEQMIYCDREKIENRDAEIALFRGW